jgi:integrase
MTKPRTGRPRKSEPVLRGKVYWARVTFDTEGVSVRRWVNLKTADLAIAKITLARIVKEAKPPTASQASVETGETFKQAADRIVGGSVIGTKQGRLDRLRRYVHPLLGSKPVKDIRAGDVRAVLEALVTRGAAKQSIMHVRVDISIVLGELWRADMLPENVATKVRIPKNAKVDRRERSVLSDAELTQYLAWQHPEPKKHRAVLERQVMGCVSRCFGGLRWGDIRALRWEALETTGGAFTKGWAPRKKSARPQLLAVPEILRPVLRDWWELAERPTTGFLFPKRRGAGAGTDERKPTSIARNLRRDLARAFGIDVAEPSGRTRSNGRPDPRLAWRTARPMTERERELLEETEFTRPVDFHSFRRQFKQALADAGVDVQQAMGLSGATDLSAHKRYLTNTSKAREIPVNALPLFGAPTFGALSAESPGGSGLNHLETWSRFRDLNSRPAVYEADCRSA